MSGLARAAGGRGVRDSLAALVLGCVLPLAAMAAFLICQFYAREQTRLTDDAISRARAMRSALERDFASTAAALQALATSERLAHGQLRAFHAQASAALRDIHADSIVLVDANGQLLLSTRLPFGTPLPKLASAPLLQRVMATGQPAVSDLYKGPLVQRFIYTVAVPVRRDGAFLFLLNATAMPEQLAAVLTEQKLPDSWRAAILDSDGKVVARSHDIGKFLGRQATPDLLHKLGSGSEGSLTTTSLDGIPVLLVYSRSPTTHWSVALAMPVDELRAGLRQTLSWLIIATLAALALGLALACFIGGNIARSITALLKPALTLGSGSMAPITPLPLREANQLGAALHDAAASLHQAQAGLRESDQRLALAVQATGLGIWTRELATGAIWASAQWRALFGFADSGPIELEDILQRIHDDDRAAVRQTLAEALGHGGQYEAEYRVVLPAGAVRWIGSRGSIAADAGGRPQLARGVAFDITARKQAELDLQHKEKQIMQLSRLSVLGELSGALAHELNQPLGAILSNAQAAQRFLAAVPPDLDEVREILSDIVDEDRRAGSVIERLRRLFDQRGAVRQPLDANELVQDVALILRNDLIGRGVTLRTELAPAAALVCADRVQLQQVLINLIVNACDAMAGLPAPQRLVVLRSAPGAEVDLSVTDCGGGIPAAALEHIFEAFYTTKEHGMGLGLSICTSIAAANGGRLWAENNAQPGASFHLCLPALAGACA